jgi:hypothetical protein
MEMGLKAIVYEVVYIKYLCLLSTWKFDFIADLDCSAHRSIPLSFSAGGNFHNCCQK